MCGIAGVIHNSATRAEEAVRVMNRRQAHRGPDDEGIHLLRAGEKNLALGHRRLSIQDLSPAGHQPMQHPERGDWIVFNGEIYNFRELRAELEANGARFRSRSDTEVLLHAYAQWGTACFSRLHGMFAFALYVHQDRRLLLVRDALGIKPLYYAWGGDSFAFASEVQAIAACGLIDTALDRRAMAGFLAYGAVPAPLTIHKHVRMLKPGTWASIDLASTLESRAFETQQYWNFPKPADRDSNQDRVGKLSKLLEHSARSHLISDVPVGVFLSSGLDSTAIATLCSHARSGDIDTFTVCVNNDAQMNESREAAETAQILGTRHHAISLTEAEVRSQAEKWLNSLDQPSVDGLNTFIIAGAVRERGIVVALSGLGGDELFAGYSTFSEVPKLLRLSKATQWIPKEVSARMASLLYMNGSSAQRQKAAELAGTRPTLRSHYFRRRRLLSDQEMRQLGLEPAQLELNEDMLPPESDPDSGVDESDPIASISVLESRFYMGNMLLRDADVFGMAHGLEIRVPLLDQSILDLAFATPGAQRFAPGAPRKRLLSEAMNGRLRPELLKLNKRGFSLPQGRWMMGPLRELFEGLLATVKSSGIVEPQGVDAIWNSFLREPQGPNWSRAWALGVLGQWIQKQTAATLREIQ